MKPSQADTSAELVKARVTSSILLLLSTFLSRYAFIFLTVSSQVISDTHSSPRARSMAGTCVLSQHSCRQMNGFFVRVASASTMG